MPRSVFLCLAILLPLAPADATSYKRLELDDLVRGAGTIAIGTVTERSFRETPDHELIAIWTDVRLEKLTFLKGEVTRSLSLTLPGGRVGKRGVRVCGMPELALAGRFLIFLAEGEGGFCPFLGWGQGVYRLVRDEETGTDLVENWQGVPIREVKGGRLVLAPEREEDEGEERTRLTLADFREEIETRLRRAEAEEREERARAGTGPEPREVRK